jgi:hypothetical protein
MRVFSHHSGGKPKRRGYDYLPKARGCSARENILLLSLLLYKRPIKKARKIHHFAISSFTIFSSKKLVEKTIKTAPLLTERGC